MKNLYLNITLGVLYFITGKISLTLLSGQDIINIGIFIPEGISLAFALYFGRKILPGIFVGQFLLAYSSSILLLPSFEIALINTAEAVIAIYLFNKFALSTELTKYKDIIGLFGIIIFALQPFSALLSNSVLLFHNHTLQSDFLYLTFSWWFGNIMGQMLMTPFLLLLFKQYKKIDFFDYLFYGLLFGAYIYFLEILLRLNNATMMLTFSIAGIILIIANKNILYGTFFSVIAAMIASYSIYLGDSNIYSSGSLVDNIINYNLYILAHIIITWILGILFEERKYYENSLKKKIDKEVTKNKEQQLLMLQQNRLAQMGEMISMIAHQWRQPLNNLSLINQLLISKYEKGKLDDTNILYFKNNSKKQIDLMSVTIDNFRDFFRAEKDKKEFILNDVIESTLDMTKAIYTSSGVQIDFHSKERFKIYGCPNTLAQAILNIINNAKDALVDSETKDKRINIILVQNKEKITITIKDNAGGIPENIIDRIFDPYFSTKENKNGTGLGLYMSNMIINEHEGARLQALNDSEGANFIITLKGEVYVDE